MTTAAPTTVVICDDHLVLAQGMAAMLASEADIVVDGIAGSVAEVVAMVDRRHPDVLLMDYELWNGVEATRALTQARPWLHVVMLTSYVDRTVLVAAIEAGCTGFLTKHGGAQGIADAIRQAAGGEALVTPSLLCQLLPHLRRTQRGVGADLTRRELEVLELLVEGASGGEIADRLYVSANTVRNHVQRILTKLDAHSRLQAVAVAVQEGIIRRA